MRHYEQLSRSLSTYGLSGLQCAPQTFVALFDTSVDHIMSSDSHPDDVVIAAARYINTLLAAVPQDSAEAYHVALVAEEHLEYVGVGISVLLPHLSGLMVTDAVCRLLVLAPPTLLARALPGASSAFTRTLASTKSPKHVGKLLDGYWRLLSRVPLPPSALAHVEGQLRRIDAAVSPIVARERVPWTPVSLPPTPLVDQFLRLLCRSLAWGGPWPEFVKDTDVIVQWLRALPETLGLQGERAYTDTACISVCLALIGFFRAAPVAMIEHVIADTEIVVKTLTAIQDLIRHAPSPIAEVGIAQASTTMPLPRSTWCKDSLALIAAQGLARELGLAAVRCLIVDVQFMAWREAGLDALSQCILGACGLGWGVRVEGGFDDFISPPPALTQTALGMLGEVVPAVAGLISVLTLSIDDSSALFSACSLVRAVAVLYTVVGARGEFESLIIETLPFLLPTAPVSLVAATTLESMAAAWSRLTDDAATPTALITGSLVPLLRRLSSQLPFPSVYPNACSTVDAVLSHLEQSATVEVTLTSTLLLAELLPMSRSIARSLTLLGPDQAGPLLTILDRISGALARRAVTFVPNSTEDGESDVGETATPEAEPDDDEETAEEYFTRLHARNEEARTLHMDESELDEFKAADPTPPRADQAVVLPGPPFPVTVTVHTRVGGVDSRAVDVESFVRISREIWKVAGDAAGPLIASPSSRNRALRVVETVSRALARDSFLLPVGDDEAEYGIHTLMPLVHRIWPYLIPVLGGSLDSGVLAVRVVVLLMQSAPEFTAHRVTAVLGRFEKICGSNPLTGPQWILDQTDARADDASPGIRMRDPTSLGGEEARVVAAARRIEAAQHLVSLGLDPRDPETVKLIAQYEQSDACRVLDGMLSFTRAALALPLDNEATQTMVGILLLCMGMGQPQAMVREAKRQLGTLCRAKVQERRQTEKDVAEIAPYLTDPPIAEPALFLAKVAEIAEVMQMPAGTGQLSLELQRFRPDRRTAPTTTFLLNSKTDVHGVLRRAASLVSVGDVRDLIGAVETVRDM
ncbi:hypothetical protein J8273_7389 [Carpediemonas membranifera]|uniref:Uncharacterized protein n=1 Tax=Carpediemonas membranifera TaxID=201153 RepID=A0A8J6ASD2_9EUKA|nr:hypothetical protein J8273_7389 [Carpediemonas membranifera]|eukprot:KAG9391115.1 hypothetical protein J8273_7389 [Carpediemonas membranifera]